MAEVLYYAIPFFVLLLIAEYVSFRHLDDDDDDLVGYDLKDTGTSLSMGLGNVVINVGWKLVVVAIYAALYELTPLRLDPHNPLTWVALFFADDLAYYWFHRVSHESRVFWASHVVHHSSQHFNLSHRAAPDVGADDVLPVLAAAAAARASRCGWCCSRRRGR